WSDSTTTTTGTYVWRVVYESPNLSPNVTDVPPPADDLDVKAQLDDGTNLPVTRTPDGNFTFERPEGPYVLVVQSKDVTYATEIPTSSPAFALEKYLVDRDDIASTTGPMTLAFTVSLPGTVAGYADVASIGARTHAQLAGADASQGTIAWNTVVSQLAKGPLL